MLFSRLFCMEDMVFFSQELKAAILLFSGELVSCFPGLMSLTTQGCLSGCPGPPVQSSVHLTPLPSGSHLRARLEGKVTTQHLFPVRATNCYLSRLETKHPYLWAHGEQCLWRWEVQCHTSGGILSRALRQRHFRTKNRATGGCFLY